MPEEVFSVRIRYLPPQAHYAWVIMKWLNPVDAIEVDASMAIFERPSDALLAGEQKLLMLQS